MAEDKLREDLIKQFKDKEQTKQEFIDAIKELSEKDIRFVDNTCKRIILQELLKSLEEKKWNLVTYLLIFYF